MSSDREESPDWLRCFQAPKSSTFVVSSDSEDESNGERPLNESPTSVDDEDDVPIDKVFGLKTDSKSPKKVPKSENKISSTRKKIKGDDDDDESDKKVSDEGLNSSVWALSSDSELSPESSPRKASEQIGEAQDKLIIGSEDKSPAKKASKDKRKGTDSSIKDQKKRDVKREENGSDVEAVEEEAPEKPVETHVSSVRLPLMLSEKVHRTKALVECEGDSIDLGGDMGSVGRVVISDNLSGDHEMYLDLKGTIYKTTIVPSRTFCVVSFGQSEAKIEAIMNDFIQLKPQSNVFEAETMVEGTLDGFLFDSDEEADKVPKGKSHQTDNNEDGEAKANGKQKKKSEKTSGIARKRGKTAGTKTQPPKKVKKKAPVAKKAKTKK